MVTNRKKRSGRKEDAAASRTKQMWGQSFDGTTLLEQGVKSELENVSAGEAFTADAVNPADL